MFNFITVIQKISVTIREFGVIPDYGKFNAIYAWLKAQTFFNF